MSDLAKMKVSDLKEELKKYGLDTKGLKNELVERLTAHLNEKSPKEGKEEKEEAEEAEEAEEEEAPAKKTNKRKEPPAAAKTPAAKKSKAKAKVDKFFRGTGEVHEDYDCMLNQTNVNANNNKYYVIQLINSNGSYYVFNRWGRVGENGQNATKGPSTLPQAIKEFEKKFKDKSANAWSARDNFVPKAGKYTLIEMDNGEEEEEEIVAPQDEKTPKAKPKTRPCTLPSQTQDLVKLICDNDMFKQAMASFDLDVKKMPLGKISKTQIQKGYDVLEELMDAIKNKKSRNVYEQLTSRFYTLIPHSFGRSKPGIIDQEENVQKKMDMLAVLGDIEIAQGLFKEQDDKEKNQKAPESVPHPLDINYDMLKCKLTPVDKNSKEWKTIDLYTKNTAGGHRIPKILEIFEVDRENEEDRFKVHDKLGNRKLLWHGTNVAVVVAILKGGLRIMPHSGGRVGRGLYFASENGKSANYVGLAGNIGIMFLNEVALGKEHHILQDDSSLTQAPKGYDSIVALGRTEPDPKQDTTMEFNEKTVVVPQGKPISHDRGNGSFFSQTEYLVYKENQVRIRYLLKMQF